MKKITKEVCKIILGSFVYILKETKDFFLLFVKLFKTKNKKNSTEKSKEEVERLILKSQEILNRNSIKSTPKKDDKKEEASLPTEEVNEKIANEILEKSTSEGSTELENQVQSNKENAPLEEENQKVVASTQQKNPVLKEDVQADYDGYSKKQIRKAKRVIFKNIFLKTTVVSFVFVCILLSVFLWDLPDYRDISSYEPPLTTRIYSRDGYIMSEYAIEKRNHIPINDIPEVVKEAFLSAEDNSFYDHQGIDIWGLGRAVIDNVRYHTGYGGAITGGSTITQQVAKIFLLSNERTYRRKVREAILALRIDRNFSKDYILELYLNEIYLGKGSYGVATAAQNYFAKPIDQLTLEEAAYLAAIPKAPARYDPERHNSRAKARRDWVINRMLIDEKITVEEATAAAEKPLLSAERQNLRLLEGAYVSEEVRKELNSKFSSEAVYNEGYTVKTTIDNSYQEFSYEALRNAIESFDKRGGYRGPLERTFTEENILTYEEITENSEEGGRKKWLDILASSKASSDYRNKVSPWRMGIVISVSEGSLRVGLLDGKIATVALRGNTWAKPEGARGTLKDFNNILQIGDIITLHSIGERWYIKQIPEVNGAMVAMNPQTGGIVAMQGGFSFGLSEFNRATQANRQPGSAFKTIPYLVGLENGFKPNSQVLDAPFVISSDEDVWKPRNNSDMYTGFVSLRYAIEHSKNAAILRLGNSIGLSKVSEMAKRLNIYEDDLPDLTGLLGSKETTLLKMVSAYSVIVNGGKEVSPHMISMVTDNNGKAIFKQDNRECVECSNIAWNNQTPPNLSDLRKTLLDPRDAYSIVNIMQGVVERGSARRVRIPGYSIGGKTGTTNDTKDVWFVGFTPNLVVGVYLGYDNPKSLGTYQSASSLAVPAFSDFMQKALKSEPPLPFRVPKGINLYWVHYKTGEPSAPGERGAVLEAFKDGYVPEKESSSVGIADLFNEGDEDGIY